MYFAIGHSEAARNTSKYTYAQPLSGQGLQATEQDSDLAIGIDSQFQSISNRPDNLKPSSSGMWEYLVKARNADDLERKLETIINLVDDDCDFLGSLDFQRLAAYMAQGNLLIISRLFELLQALVLSPLYKSAVIRVVKGSMLFHEKPQVRYSALELLSEDLEHEEILEVLLDVDAQSFFVAESESFVKDYYQEITSSI
jgi:hypothetical protein